MLEPVLNPIWVFFGYAEIPKLYAIIGGIIIISAIIVRTILTTLRYKKLNDGISTQSNN
jgi:drug/metabolite transporter (DMT)-like permease